MSLFTPKYASDNEKIALSALDRISDYPTLRKIADPYTAKNRARLKVRAEAALKMKDKDLFAETVCADRDLSAFSSYMENINDQRQVEAIIKYLGHHSVSSQCEKNRVARNRLDTLRKQVRQARVADAEKLIKSFQTDQERADYILNHPDMEEIIKMLIPQIEDRDLLLKIARDKECWYSTADLVFNKLGVSKKERFFQGEKLFWMDEKEVLRSLTTDEIKDNGLTVPLFEKLYEAYDLKSFTDKVLIPCADQNILHYLIQCLDDRNKYIRNRMGNKASYAARLLAFLYHSGCFTDEIKKQTGKVLQDAGEMPQFNMHDPEERDMAIGYHADPEIRFDPEEAIGTKYIW